MKTKIEKAIKILKQVPGLHEFTMEHCFLAGGAVRDLARGNVPKDYDIFFKTKAAAEEFKRKFSMGMVESVLGNYNFSDIQFITMNVGSPEKVIEQFDWNVNQVFYDFANGKASGIQSDNALRINTKAQTPLSAIMRIPHLLSKGFVIYPEELLFAYTFVSTVVNLSNAEAVKAQTCLMSNGGGNTDYRIDAVLKRATEAALTQSPLSKALE